MESSKPESNKPVSIRDIAEMAGVSIATVSRVVNNNGRFSEATRERVQKVIDETGYVPNMTAKSLREQRSKTIGMIVPDISNDFFSTLALHTEQYLSKHGYSVFVCNNANSSEREQEYLKTLVSKQVDGIICISGTHSIGESPTARNIPLVCVDRYPEHDESIPRVISADVEGGRLATEHLIAKGCTHVLFISSRVPDYNKTNREAGYEQALRANGLDTPAEYRLYLEGAEPSMVESERLVSAFIAQGLPFDGIFAVSDHAATGALRAVEGAGLCVPADVKVVGFDDSVYSQLTTPQITSVRRFPKELAENGCAALLQLIEGKTPPFETIVPVELVERASTGA